MNAFVRISTSSLYKVLNAHKIMLGPHTVVKRTVECEWEEGGEKKKQEISITFVIEETLEDFVHLCTVDDVCEMVRFTPAPIGKRLLAFPAFKRLKSKS